MKGFSSAVRALRGTAALLGISLLFTLSVDWAKGHTRLIGPCESRADEAQIEVSIEGLREPTIEHERVMRADRDGHASRVKRAMRTE